MGSPDLLRYALAGLAHAGTRRTARHLLASVPDETLVPAATAQLDAATGEALAALLQMLHDRGAPGLGEHLVTAARGSDAVSKSAALTILATQPGPAHADLFRDAAAHESDAVRQAAAEGLLALAEGARERGDAQAAQGAYQEVLGAKVADETRRKALHGLGQIGGTEALGALSGLLDHPRLRQDAGRALVTAADALARAGRRDEAIDLLKRIVTAQPLLVAGHEAGLRLRQMGVEDDFARDLGFVTRWWLIGPLPNPDNSAYEKAYFPEQEIALDKEYEIEGSKLRWKAHHERANVHGMLDLVELIAPATNVCCYAYAEVSSDQARDMVIRLGTDDGYVLWLNGERLAGQPGGRPLTVDEDSVPAKLREGSNRLLLKVLQGGSAWRFCLRFTDAEGRPVVLGQE
jgi:hypothetical protein